MSWWPTAAEAASLRFVVPFPSFGLRLAAGASLLLAGAALWTLTASLAVVGFLLVALGHLVLWVRRQTTAPGGATPSHEEVWAPVEDDWLRRVEKLERRGEAWDASRWDITSGKGFGTFLLLAAVVAAAVFGFGWKLGPGHVVSLLILAAVLWVPLWLNGMRTTWNPSELRLKGEALEEALRSLDDPEAYEAVPLLALREGRRGKYPVDARLMLRPREDDGTGFLGIQVQVAINNVRGKDFPYLYCVVLGKPGFVRPEDRPPNRHALVFETGGDHEVSYLVVRQHADDTGGWHTSGADVDRILRASTDAAGEAVRSAGKK